MSDLVTIPEAAKIYGSTPERMYALIQRGDLVAYYGGAKTMLSRQQVEARRRKARESQWWKTMRERYGMVE